MANFYSDSKTYPKFGSFVRAVIGLPFCPLDRLEEAIAILKKIAMANDGVRHKFCLSLLRYLRRTWVDGSIPPEVWNMFEHQGVTTNNHAEAFNHKMGAKKKISKHPNPYILAEEIKIQLKEGSDTVIAETVTSHTKKVDPRIETLKKRKKGLMRDLRKRNIDLESYIVSMGANSIKYQPLILVDPDPLADIGSDSDNESIEENDCLGEDEISLDESVESPSPKPTPAPRRPAAKTVAKPLHNKKGRRKKQKPCANSEDSFLHVESLADLDAPFQASLGGDDLRNARRAAEEETDNTSDNAGTSNLSAAVLASAGIGVLSRFISRSSASRSPRKSPAARRPSGCHRSGSDCPAHAAKPFSLASDPISTAKQRASS